MIRRRYIFPDLATAAAAALMIGGTSRLHPPFGLDFEADEAIDTNSHLSGSIVSTKGFRQGAYKWLMLYPPWNHTH